MIPTVAHESRYYNSEDSLCTTHGMHWVDADHLGRELAAVEVSSGRCWTFDLVASG